MLHILFLLLPRNCIQYLNARQSGRRWIPSRASYSQHNLEIASPTSYESREPVGGADKKVDRQTDPTYKIIFDDCVVQWWLEICMQELFRSDEAPVVQSRPKTKLFISWIALVAQRKERVLRSAENRFTDKILSNPLMLHPLTGALTSISDSRQQRCTMINKMKMIYEVSTIIKFLMAYRTTINNVTRWATK